MTAVVADTHTIIWYLRETSRLSDNATIALDTATQTGNLIYIAAISLVEIIYLSERGRIPVELFDQLISTLNQPDSALEIVPLDQTVVRSRFVISIEQQFLRCLIELLLQRLYL